MWENRITIPEPLSGAQIVMQDLGRLQNSGIPLTLTEQTMAMSAYAALDADRFGPGPANMKLAPMSLPENIKGAIANYAS